MARTRDMVVALSLVSAAEALLVYLVAPQYMLANNFSRSILRLVILNVVLYLLYGHFIYPFFFSPLRDLPKPKVRVPVPLQSVRTDGAGQYPLRQFYGHSEATGRRRTTPMARDHP